MVVITLVDQSQEPVAHPYLRAEQVAHVVVRYPVPVVRFFILTTAGGPPRVLVALKLHARVLYLGE